MRPSVILLFASFLALSLAGCNEESGQLVSLWKDREIKVDGDNSEWKGVKLAQGKYLSMAAMNDDTGAYFYAETEDMKVGGQILGMLDQSCITWFVADGRWNEKWGLELKVERREGINPAMFRGSPPLPASMALLNQTAFIIRPGNSSAEMAAARPEEVAASVGTSGKIVFYELFVSLARLGIGTDKPLSIGFETSRVDRDRIKAEMAEKMKRERSGMGMHSGGESGGMRGDGMFGGGGGMPGGAGRHGRGGGRRPANADTEKDLPEEFTFWREVKLAQSGERSSTVSPK